MKIIKDPIHGYIELTDLEVRLIDSNPIFRRIRRVRQLGMADEVYPSANHTRFEHSIGVMHVAGEIITSLLNRFKPIEEKGPGAYLIENQNFRNKFTLWKTSLVQSIIKLKELKDFEGIDNEYFLTDAGLVQFVRLLGLFHDIGHLPYSHTFETAIKSFSVEDPQIKRKITEFSKAKDLFVQEHYSFSSNEILEFHEAMGHKLLKFKISGNSKSIEEIVNSIYGSGATDLIILILEFNNINMEIYSPLNVLHQIVSGSIDADRIDYVLRDIQKSGITLGSFDKELIVNNIIVTQHNDLWTIAFRHQALSGLTSFYLQRYFCYRWLYNHHVVKLFDTMIASEILLLLKKDSQLLNNILDLKIFDPNQLVDEFILSKLKEGIYNKNEFAEQDEKIITKDGYFTDLNLIAKTLLDRVNLPISLWKSWKQFSDLVQIDPLEIRIKLLDLIERFTNKNFSQYFFNIKSQESKVNDFIDSWLKQILINDLSVNFDRDAFYTEIYKNLYDLLLNNDLELKNIFFIQIKEKNYKKLDIILIDDYTDDIMDLGDLSPLVSSLIDPPRDTPPFFIFLHFSTEEARKKFKVYMKKIDFRNDLFEILKNNIKKFINN